MLVTSLESSSSPRLGLGAKCLAGIMSRILQTTSAWACGLCNPKVNIRDCSARGRLCSLWDTQPGCAFPKRENGTIIYRSDPGKIFLSLPGFLWPPVWLMTTSAEIITAVISRKLLIWSHWPTPLAVLWGALESDNVLESGSFEGCIGGPNSWLTALLAAGLLSLWEVQ